jgi:uncharacterized alkaline shock family protein YloU
MSRDAHVIRGAGGTITISADALSNLVVAAAERVEGARVRRPRRGLGVSIEHGTARVEVELAARFGTVVPELAETVQREVGDALRAATGLTVAAVDVSVEELDL